MGRSIRWGENERARWDLLYGDVREVATKYDYSPEYIKTARCRIKKQIKEGKVMEPRNPETIPAEETQLVSEISGWWEVVTANPNDPENPVVTRAYKHSTKKRPIADELAEQFVPATPARITPSKRKPQVRDHRTLFVISDAQIDYRRLEDGSLEPIHDERAIRVAHMLCRDVQPDEIINLGDTVDLAALSRFKKDSDHFQRTLGPSFQRVHDMYAQFRADNPQAKITEVDSNHNTRLKDFMLRQAPDLYGVRRAGDDEAEYPMFTYPYFTNLSHVGVDYVSGYGAAEYIYGAEYDKPPIVFKHGEVVASQASTAARESKLNPENHIVRGHGHRSERHTRTNRAGQYLMSLQLGALCRTTGEVPSYHSAVDDRGRVVHHQEDWQQSILIIRDYEGDYEFHDVYIRDGLAIYDGKLYRGDLDEQV